MSENGSKETKIEDDYRKTMTGDFGNRGEKIETWHILEVRSNRVHRLKS